MTVTVTFTTAAGVAVPRDTIDFFLATNEDTAIYDQDFTGKSAQRTLLSMAWTENAGVYTATATETFDTIDDSVYEGSLQFKVELGVVRINPVCPPGTAAGTFCEATVTITDDDTLGVTGVEVSSTAHVRLLQHRRGHHLQGDVQRQRDGGHDERHAAVGLRHRRADALRQLHRAARPPRS